ESRLSPPSPPFFPYTTLFRSLVMRGVSESVLVVHIGSFIETGGNQGDQQAVAKRLVDRCTVDDLGIRIGCRANDFGGLAGFEQGDRKSTRLNSSHVSSSYAVF